MSIEEMIQNGGCENCVSLITLYKHPWNTNYKGSTSEKADIKVCIVENTIDNNRKGTIMENTETGCEMFHDINSKEFKTIYKYDL